MKYLVQAIGFFALATFFIACSSDGSSSGPDENSDLSSSSQDLSGSSGDWSWNVSKESFLNPDVDYGSLTDSRDGKIYKTVQIGDQVWMAENLNYDPGQGGSGENKYDWTWCYNQDSANCEVTGRFYTWAAAVDSVTTGCGYGKTCELSGNVQGVCPKGWHLPSPTEWALLFDAVGGQSTAGKVFKTQSGWSEYYGSNGTNDFGFSVLPAGGRDVDGTFAYVGYNSYFWSSTENYKNFADYLYLDCAYEDAYIISNTKSVGFSVRCLKD